MTLGEQNPQPTTVSEPETTTEPILTLETVYVDHFGMLSGLATKYGASDPEVTVQTVFEKAQRHMNNNPTAQLHAGWYVAVLRTTIVDEHRKSSRRPEQPVDPTEYLYADAPDLSAEASFTRVDLEGVMGHIACILSERNTQWLDVFVLREVQGHTYQEISQRLGIPVGTVASTLKRAKIALAEVPELRAFYDAA